MSRWSSSRRRMAAGKPRRASRESTEMVQRADGQLVEKPADRGTLERSQPHHQHGVRHPGEATAAQPELAPSRTPSVAMVRDPFDQLVLDGRLAGPAWPAHLPTTTRDAWHNRQLSEFRAASDLLRAVAWKAGILRSQRNPLDQSPRGRALQAWADASPADTAAKAFSEIGGSVGEPAFGLLQDLLIFETKVADHEWKGLWEAFQLLSVVTRGLPLRNQGQG